MNATPDNTLADPEQKQAISLIRPALREYRTWTTDSSRWKGFKPRSGDIIVATYPKCGTTWMQQIVSSLIFQDATSRPLLDIAPWIGGRFFGDPEAIYATINGQKHRRSLKSNEPLDGIPFYDQIRLSTWLAMGVTRQCPSTISGSPSMTRLDRGSIGLA